MLKTVLKLMLAAVVMVLGFAALLGGIMMLTVASDPMPYIAIPCLILGPILGVAGLLTVIRLNRAYQHEAWQATVDKPDLIFARWTDHDGRDVMFAIPGLFIDKKYYAFAESYSKLCAIALEDEKLTVTVAIYAGSTHVEKEVKVEIPAEQHDAVTQGVSELHAALAN